MSFFRGKAPRSAFRARRIAKPKRARSKLSTAEVRKILRRPSGLPQVHKTQRKLFGRAFKK